MDIKLKKERVVGMNGYAFEVWADGCLVTQGWSAGTKAGALAEARAASAKAGAAR